MSPKAPRNSPSDLNWQQLANAALTFKQTLATKIVQEIINLLRERAPVLLAKWSDDFIKWLKELDFQRGFEWGAKRLIPRDRFGQAGLERRVRRLREGLEVIFPLGTDAGRTDLMTSLDQVATGLALAGKFPLLKRKQAHFKIDRILDDMERALLDAVLPKPPEAQS